MIIDVSSPRTYPVELEHILVEFFSKMPEDIKKKIEKKKIEHEVDVRCAIEDYVGPFKVEELYKSLIEIMKNYDLIVYHSTKVLDKGCFLKDGIHPNEWNWYEKTLIKTFKNIGISKQEMNRAMSLIKNEYNRKYIGGKSVLCFFSDLSLVDDKETAGYEQFCENIGGELARWALKNREPRIYKYLKEHGEQLIIKFVLPFSKVTYYQQDGIVYQFICRVAGKFFWNYEYKVSFDGTTEEVIGPEKILEFIHYDKEVDY